MITKGMKNKRYAACAFGFLVFLAAANLSEAAKRKPSTTPIPTVITTEKPVISPQ